MVFNKETRELEEKLQEHYSFNKSKVSEIPTEDLYPMMEGWLKSNVFVEYNIHKIEMTMFSDGMSIAVLIDFNRPQFYKCIQLLGMPNHVYKEDDKFFAHWIRNIVSWF